MSVELSIKAVQSWRYASKGNLACLLVKEAGGYCAPLAVADERHAFIWAEANIAGADVSRNPVHHCLRQPAAGDIGDRHGRIPRRIAKKGVMAIAGNVNPSGSIEVGINPVASCASPFDSGVPPEMSNDSMEPSP